MARIHSRAMAAKVTSAEAAAEHIRPGDRVGMSGFTGAGHPKAVPQALSRRIGEANARGEGFAISLWTGAATAPELAAALADVDGLDLLLPFQSDPVTRRAVNSGRVDFLDLHLSHIAPMVSQGVLGNLDVAVIEIIGITEDGALIPSTSLGNNKTWLDEADRVILEVNSRQPERLYGMHDVFGDAKPPHRSPIPIAHASDRIGTTTLHCPPEKVVAIVETDQPDVAAAFKPADPQSEMIAGHLLEFLHHEVKYHRLPPALLPLQSGVGNVANAVLAGLDEGSFHQLTSYTEIIQDGMLALLRSGTMSFASATSFCLSAAGIAELETNLADYHDRIMLRPQEISNHPEVIRRLGCLAMNGMIEADLYGNVNSTHVMGSSMQNGIGGSGDFARHSYISMFLTPSTAKGGALSCIVPMVSHVDHTEHDVHVLVTEQGLADLRGLSPRRRAQKIISQCAHPDFRPALQDYLDRASAASAGKHTPHLLSEALSWHARYLDTGTMSV